MVCARVYHEAEAMRLVRQGDLGCEPVTAEEWVSVLGSNRMLGSHGERSIDCQVQV